MEEEVLGISGLQLLVRSIGNNLDWDWCLIHKVSVMKPLIFPQLLVYQKLR